MKTAFRTLKSASLEVQPIDHRGISHAFLRMLAYYVEYHLRKALAPMLGLKRTRKAGKRSAQKRLRRRSGLRKKDHDPTYRTGTQELRTADGTPLGVVSQHDQTEDHQLTVLPPMTSTQQQAFKLLNISIT